MAELTAEITARFDQIQRELAKTDKEAAKLERELNRAGAAALKLDKSLDVMGQGAEFAGEELRQMNKAAGRSSSIFFQAGQAVSDFAVAGVLGAANNIEFLAFQMGASGPLIAAITALSVTALVFRDDLEEAFNPLGTILEDTKQAFSELLTLIGGDDRELVLFTRNLPRALKEQREEVVRLRKELLETLDNPGIATLFGLLDAPPVRVPTFIAPLTQLEEQLSAAEGGLEDLEERFKSLSKEEQGFSTALQNSVISLDQQIVNIQRAALAELGFEKQLSDVTDKKLATVIEEGELEEFILELKKKKDKLTKEEKTTLDRIVETNTKLKEQLEALRNLDTSRLGQITEQNRQLREQIKVVQRLNDADKIAATIAASSLGGFTKLPPAGADKRARNIDDVIEDINKARAKAGRQTLKAQGLSGSDEDIADEPDKQVEALQRIVEGVDRSKKAFEEAGITAEEFFTSTRQGAEELGLSLESAAGNFASAFGDAYKATGESNSTFFALFKATSIAEATISTYNAANKALTAGPIVGPILAAGIIAAGLGNVAKIASIKPGGSGSGAGGSSSVSGVIQSAVADPRQGRDGRFRRDPVQSESGFIPISSLADFSIPEFTFRLQGEDFVAGTDKTIRRQSRTRGTSNIRSTSVTNR